MTTVTPSRRERLRAATVSEIKQAGRRLLVSGGPSAISLRAIAREMGMTAPAIYRYFPSLDALIVDLCTDLYAELATVLEAARAPLPADRPAERILAMARAFRHWSIAHPAEFSLMFGEPVPGVAELDETCGEIPGGILSFCQVFLTEFDALWRRHRPPPPPPGVISDRLADHLAPYLATYGDGLPTEAMYVYVSGWIRLYGMVALEVFGHLSWAFTDAEPLFESELAGYLHLFTGGGEGTESGG